MTEREKAAFLVGIVAAHQLLQKGHSIDFVIAVMAEALPLSMDNMPTVHDIVRETCELLDLRSHIKEHRN